MMRVERLLRVCAWLVALPGLASLYPHLDLLPKALIPLLLVLAFHLDRKGEVPRRTGALLAGLTVLLFAFYLVRIPSQSLSIPVVNMAALVLAVRLVGEKTPRQLIQLIALSLFALAGSTLISIDMDFFLYLLMLLVLVPASLLLRCAETSCPGLSLSRLQLRRLLRYGLVLPAGSMVLMFFFFAILPRTSRPLWDFLNPEAQATVGFSETVEPGRSESLVTRGRLAFRVESPSLPQDQLYWRGNVLNEPQGGRWVRSAGHRPAPSRVAGGRIVEQTFYPEDRRGRVLFGLDLPQEMRQVRSDAQGDATFTRNRGQSLSRLYYGVRSRMGAQLMPTRGIDRDFYLRLPEEISPRIRALAARLDTPGGPRADLESLGDFFRKGGYRYSMESLPTGEDALARFLFETRAGHCEFFAGSFATLARLLRIPARLVGGYLGGEYNDLGGYYLVTEDMAHVWVEIHLEDEGWVRLDPSRFAVNSGAELLGSRGGNLSLWQRLWDGLDYAWGRAIIRFDLSSQVELLRFTSSGLKRLRGHLDPESLLYPALGGAAIATGAFLFWNLRFGPGPARRLERRYRRLLQKRLGDAARDPSLGLFDLARQSGIAEAMDFARLYADAIYRDRPLSRKQRRKLAALLRRIRRPREGGAAVGKSP